MLKAMKVIAGDLKNLYGTSALNSLHLMLKGIPYGLLLPMLLELLKPKDDISVSYLVLLFSIMAIVMIANIFLAIKVYTDGFISAFSMSTNARLRLSDHLRKLSLGFFKQHDPGDISALLLQDMSKVEVIFSHFFMDVLACFILPVLMAAFLLFSNAEMTVFMIVSALLAFPVLLAGQKIIALFGRKHIAIRNQTASDMLEYLQGIKTIKAFLLTGKNFSRLDVTMQNLRNESIKLEMAGSLPVLLYCLILDLGFVGLILYGAFLLVQGSVGVAAFILFLVIGRKFFEPLLLLGIFVTEMRYMGLAADRVAAVMDIPPLSAGRKSITSERLDIAFDNVSFGYDGRIPVLNAIDLQIPAQTMTALVGPSGSGKTTIASLLARFWDVDKGSISIGGTDIRQLPIEDLYSLISIVFQDVYLFQDTIFNNIKVGKKDATREEIIEAAQRAQCHEFIEQLEFGYETLVGEGGATLSGGEKQRISIARALLKDAPIVVLDEATASLDPENELQIQLAINAMVKNKTLIVIAHRLKTIVGADQIVVLNDEGKITECGRHEHLIKNGGSYARLWLEQQRTGGWKFSSGRHCM